MSGKDSESVDQALETIGMWAEHYGVTFSAEAGLSLARAVDRAQLAAFATLLAQVRVAEKRAEAAEAEGFQRAISAAVAIIDARHDEIAEAGTEFSPFHAGMVDALSWASDEVGELATKAKAEGADR